MNPLIPFRIEPAFRARQRGAVLFFALIALVAMSLAAVALIRSVDTSTIIAGNLAFKQSATSAGDEGIDAAVAWLVAHDSGQPGIGVDVNSNPAHAFNLTCLAIRAPGSLSASDPGCPAIIPGYHSSLTSFDLFADATWNNINTVLVSKNASTGNTVRYIIQRMCRTANTVANNADCLYGGAIENTNSLAVQNYADACTSCSSPGLSPQLRVTARAEGPRNTISYVQAFVY